MTRVAFSLVLFSIGLCVLAQEPKGPQPGEKKADKKGDKKADKDGKGEKVVVALNTGGHTSMIRSMAFTPDGKKLVTGEKTKIHVWAVPEGELERSWHLPSRIHQIAVSPTGSTVAAAGNVEADDHPVWLLDLNTGECKTFKVEGVRSHDGIRSLTFSPNGKRLAWASWYEAGTINIEKAHVGNHIARADRVNSVAFDKDGDRLLVNGGNGNGKNQFLVFDAKKDAKKNGPPLFALEDAQGSEGHVSWSSDNSYFAGWLKEEERKLFVWNANGKSAGKAIALTGNFDIRHVQFVGADKLVAVGTGEKEARAYLVNVAAHKVVKHDFPWANPQNLDPVVAVAPTGKYLALTSSPGFRVQLVDLDTGKRLPDVGHAFPIPEGVAWKSNSRAISWRTGTDAEGRSIPPRGLDLSALKFLDEEAVAGFKAVDHPEGYHFTFDEPKRKLFLVHKGKKIETKFDQPVDKYTSYKDDGKLKFVVLGGWGESPLSIIDAETGEVTHIDESSDGTALSVSPDGKFLLLARHDQRLLIYKFDDDKKKRWSLFLHVLVAGQDWIVWTHGGYYASTFTGERLMGFASPNGPRQPLTFYPVERFRAQLHKPELIKKAFELGTVAAAVQATKTAHVEIARALPPKATLKLVSQAGDRVKVEVTATTGNEEPVKALRLQIDGRSLPLDEKGNEQGYFEPKGEPKRAVRTWEVNVPPGVHQLSVLVRGSESADRSNAVEVKAPMPESQKPTMYALSVGINYQWNAAVKNNPGELKGAENDAQTMHDALRKYCAGAGDRYRFRAVEGGEPLLGQKATSTAILDRLKEVRQKGAKPGDLVVLFYAGHGVAEEREFYLLTADVNPQNIKNSGLSGSKLRDALKAMPCQVLLIFDACQSGQALNRFAPATDELGRSLADDEAGVTVLAAAMAHETAGEKDGNGRFTVALRDALALKPGAIFDRDQQVMNVRHWHVRAEDLVRGESKGKQNPVLLAPWSTPPLVIRKVVP